MNRNGRWGESRCVGTEGFQKHGFTGLVSMGPSRKHGATPYPCMLPFQAQLALHFWVPCIHRERVNAIRLNLERQPLIVFGINYHYRYDNSGDAPLLIEQGP